MKIKNANTRKDRKKFSRTAAMTHRSNLTTMPLSRGGGRK